MIVDAYSYAHFMGLLSNIEEAMICQMCFEYNQVNYTSFNV